MFAIQLYSRFMDSKQRLWVCIERFGEPDGDVIKPGTIKMLCVNEERVEMIPHQVIDDNIKAGRLRQISD